VWRIDCSPSSCAPDPDIEQEQAVSGYYRQIAAKVSAVHFLNLHGYGDETGRSRNFAKLIRTSDTGIRVKEAFIEQTSF